MDALDRAFADERRFISGCGNVHALLDRMADYRDDRAAAVARGVTKARQRIDDLLELAEDRIAELKADALRETARKTEARARPPEVTAPPVQPRQAALNRPAAPRAPARSREADETERRLKRLEAELAEARAAEQSARRERAAAEERERERERERARADEAARRKRKAAAERASKAPEPVAAESRPSAATPAPSAPTSPTLEEDPLFADLFARSIQPPPVPPGEPSAVYTGGDLAKYRAEKGLTQRLAAVQFGVAHGTIAKAEMDPTKVLGEILQAGMRNVQGR